MKKKQRFTPEKVTKLAKNEVFVFGSNLMGHHGAGAAATARVLFGARDGVGFGMTGSCYAIPTNNRKLKSLALKDIAYHVRAFMWFAYTHPANTWIVTKIGCGFAGYTVEEIAPLFADYPPNVILPEEFVNELKK